MSRCLISLGANLGDPLETIHSAVELLRQQLQADDASFEPSRLFRTPPIGGPAGQPPFVNAVAAVDTSQSLLQVWETIRHVERTLGRRRDRRWEARRIDLDILLYGQTRIWTQHLKVPHPRMCMRRFILVPALDVASPWVDPVSGWSVQQLAAPLQTGPGSLCLVCDSYESTLPWLEEVSRLAAAKLLPIGKQTNACGARSISLVSHEEFLRNLRAPEAGAVHPKLTVFLAEPPKSPMVDWESENIELASQLNLCGPDSPPGLSANPAPVEKAIEVLPAWIGPRYLLPSSDRQWAIHEMVAALEAMDCPIEPIHE